MVMEVVHEEMAEGNMQCESHPYKSSTPGGICAFCLQEKLGKLISSPSVAVFPSSASSTSSSPSFRSTVSVPGKSRLAVNSHECSSYQGKRSRLPFVLIRKKKKMEGKMVSGIGSTATIVFRRSISTTTPGRALHFMDEDYTPRKRGFWSFLHTPNHSSVKKTDKTLSFSSETSVRSMEKKGEEMVMVDENESPAVNRKVCRSRSIGCGSRSFSGDIFERISTGFGDCTLRRAESQREGKSKSQSVCGNGQDFIKERVRCGIFSGFMISSSQLDNVKTTTTTGGVSNSRRNWRKALTSPMRVFTGKRDFNSNKNNTLSSPNLTAIPSLLAFNGWGKGMNEVSQCEHVRGPIFPHVL